MGLDVRRRATGIAALAAFLSLAVSFERGQPPAGAAGAKPTALYTAAQASAGAKTYAASCAQCHGANLEGDAGPALAGPGWKTISSHTHITVSELYDFIAQQMPLNAPASLPKDKYLAIMAFILKSNGYPAGSSALSLVSAHKSKMVVDSLKSH